jgi:glycosyltransferase involved in cell wall biosynthesis
MPKVSVILPTYNSSALLPRAISSVVGQNFDDLEVLVVDDGSTDDTVEIILEIQSRDERVRYMKTPHRGVGFARDTGLRHARGELIAWIDADDLWLPGKLRTQVGILQTHPGIDILFADWWNINHARETQELGFFQNKVVLQSLQLTRIEDALFQVEAGMAEALLRESLIHFQTVMWRAAILDKTGGIDPALDSAEDFEFFWRAALFGASYAFLDRPLAERHKYESGITSNKVFSWMEMLQALDRCWQLAGKTGRRDLFKPIRKFKKRAFRNLLWEHGSRGERVQVLRIYRSSLGTGFSLRTSATACAALLGPGALAWIERNHGKNEQDERD